MAGLISNGTYVLGDPNTRDLYLGKGLKQGIEDDKWYIAADETVLWEGTASTNITLSEAYTNFEYIEVFNEYNSTKIATSRSVISMMAMTSFSNNLYHTFGVLYNISGNSITYNAGFHTWRKNGTIDTESRTDSLRIIKVVGINRKRG